MAKSYDFVVIGAGVFGAWIALYLREAGFTVALLEQYGAASGRASSGGETRIIRMGYGPDALYTRMAAQSLVAWKQLAERARQKLFINTGVLWLSAEGDHHTGAIRNALRNAGIPCEELPAAEVRRKYPQLAFDDVATALLEPDSGVLLARQSVQWIVEEAARLGVEFTIAAVEPPVQVGKLPAVRTLAGKIVEGHTFIFACGPWLPKVFPELLLGRIRPTRQEVFFLGVPPGDDCFSVSRMPAWLHHTHPMRPYALPDIANRGLKIAFDIHGPEFDPDNGSREVIADSRQELRTFLKRHIPALASAPILETRVCQYENTATGDLLIDRHPEMENVWLVGGGSGHGFKHGPAVGQYLRERVLGRGSPEERFSVGARGNAKSRTVF
jgi:sarcosine oxidase